VCVCARVRACIYNQSTMRQFINFHRFHIDFKKAYDSVGRKLLYIFAEFVVPIKLIRLIKMCLNETYSKVHISKLLS
jgi:hypothetical protein